MHVPNGGIEMKNEGQEQTKAIAEIKKEVQLSQWQRQIEERQVSGLGVAQWCERQGISKTTYYYRLRKVWEHLCQLANPTVTEVVEAQEECRIVPIHTANQAAASRIEIKHRELSITFMGEASPDALKAIVEALRSC